MGACPSLSPESMKPFAESTVEVFEKMLRVRLRESPVEVKSAPEGTFELSAVIGVSGAATASFVLSMPLDAARRIVARMLGETALGPDADVADGIGELVNIVAGKACQKLGERGTGGLALSLPAVVVGRHRVVWPSRDLPCLLMRFYDSELGPFSIEVNMRSAP